MLNSASSGDPVAASAAWAELWRVLLTPRSDVFGTTDKPPTNAAAVSQQPHEEVVRRDAS